MTQRIKEICKYKDMIYSFTRRELRGKYQKSVLGFLWSFIYPLFQILLYTLVFTFVFPSGIENYYIYLMTGIIPWTFTSDSLAQGAMSIVGNGDMVKKIYFPREVLCISNVTAKFINMVLSLIVVLVFIFISGIGINIKLLVLLPLVMLLQYMMTLGLSLFFAAITVYLRDMEYIVSVILMFWVWATPIMYSVNNINLLIQKWIRINPFTSVMYLYRDILFYHNTPEIIDLLIPIAAGMVFMFVGEIVFMRLSKNFAEEF